LTAVTQNKGLWIITILVCLCILSAGAFWIHAHPYADGWDESYYVNQGIVDYRALISGDIYQIWGVLMYCANDRPFAFRLVALPFTYLFGPNIDAMRASCFTCFILASFFTFLAARQMHNTQTGLLAALLFMLSPEVLSSSVRFYVEGSTYLALAATLYLLFKYIDRQSPHTPLWIPLGLCLGFGFIAKASYALIIVPPLLFVFFIAIKKWGIKQALTGLIKPLILAFFISAPWWVLNFQPALKHIQAAKVFSWTLQGSGIALLAAYMHVFLNCVTGYFAGILIIITMIAVTGLLLFKKVSLETDIKNKLWICFWGGVFLVSSQIASSNHCLRLVSPVMIPLAIMGAYFIAVSGKTLKFHSLFLCITLLIVQLGFILSSFRLKNEPFITLWDNRAEKTFAYREQWDWTFLYNLLKPYRQDAIQIGFIGAVRPMNPSNIAYPWIINNETIPVNFIVKDRLNKDFQVILNEAMKYNVIVILADYPYDKLITTARNNSHNVPLIGILSENQDFQQPVTIKVGRFKETTLMVFIKNDIARPEN
jgi:4-amino-4-deoxy-L-arabinose transferase-like glycosyltransferase